MLIGVYFVFFSKQENWTLMICETKLESGECDEIANEVSGYATQNKCAEAGVILSKKAGYECGLNCKKGSLGLNICEKICNKNGCG